MVKRLGLKIKEQKGFTLIELLAVIVILGIIAAIAIPAIGNVISKSENKAKVQDGLLIIDAAKMYVANNPNTPTGTILVGANTATPPAGSIDLSDYLDRVKDDTFVVSVTLDSATGNYSYILTTHESVSLTGINTDSVAGVSEQELIDFVQ